MSQYHRENPDAPISHELFYRRTSPEQPLLRGVHVGTDPGSQPVELPKTFEQFKYELRDEYHTFDRAQVDFDLIEQHGFHPNHGRGPITASQNQTTEQPTSAT